MNKIAISSTLRKGLISSNKNDLIIVPEGALNNAPVAVGDSVTTPYETSILIDVLANDTDLDMDNLSIDSVGSPSNGTAVIESGQIRYTPNAGYSGADSFTYVVTDGQDTDEGTVNVTVEAEAIAYLLDEYPALAGWSLNHKLRSNYSGAAFRIKRSSDNAEFDVPFSGEVVDESAITTFVGANDATITVIYGQMASNNLTQPLAANQPQLVSGGVINKVNGKLCTIAASDKYLNYPFAMSSRRYFFFIGKAHTTGIPCLIGSNSPNDYLLLAETGSSSSVINNNLVVNSAFKNGAAWSIPGQRGAVYTALSNQNLLYIDATFSFVNSFTRVGYQNPLTAPMYQFQELIVYSSDPSSNRSSIEAIINNNYGIY